MDDVSHYCKTKCFIFEKKVEEPCYKVHALAVIKVLVAYGICYEDVT